MNYYTTNTEFNCGIDLHTKQMYICAMDPTGMKKGQNTSFSQPLFLRTEFGMAVGSPLMSGFLRLDILRDLGFGFGMDSNDWKQVVAFRALVTRPLQTGLTRHRFPERGVSEYL